MKINLQRLGYAVGVLVCFPLLLYFINYFFYSGNKEAKEYSSQYINESIVVNIEIDKNYEADSRKYITRLTKRGKGIKWLYWITFYSKEHRQYLSLLIFNAELKFDLVELIIRGESIATVKVLVNTKQLNNSAYGSKENPVPVFGIDLINPENGNEQMIKIFHSDNKELHSDIDQYLKFIIPKKEFKQVFIEKQSSRE